ncbi:hypothetical protein [Rhodoferax aquaticus]|uniref:Uncharacterized protein n=1 Tax=Rhodoferax aquaticus TaxID=2527691 RepID=A0A515EK62_9BURK|nr:hypothetical protein [Rhodoferax aquaticus]QDL53051.1 hypothetical protein EXZ61_02085 [Rhodoferax aquaticus]
MPQNQGTTATPVPQVGTSTTLAPNLAALCAGVLPVWARHIATSRAQSEVAVTQMLKAFADISPHIGAAERQSVQITEALSTSDDGITGLVCACERTLAPVLQNTTLPPEASAAIEKVLDMVRSAVSALEGIAKPFAHETQMVAEHVDRMYMGFQYQDRISQMMALLEGDIVRLQDACTGKAPDTLNLEAWLARLESLYAMSEQRQDHLGASNPSTDSTETGEPTFF